MKINKCNSAIPAYKINSNYEPLKKDSGLPASSVKNMDKVEFSSASRTKLIDYAKADIKNKVEGFASPERIAALKSMISDGTYNVPAESVASAIFEG